MTNQFVLRQNDQSRVKMINFVSVPINHSQLHILSCVTDRLVTGLVTDGSVTRV